MGRVGAKSKRKDVPDRAGVDHGRVGRGRPREGGQGPNPEFRKVSIFILSAIESQEKVLRRGMLWFYS